MTRRQSECFRNLDDPLKIFSLLTVKSCGLVLLFYGCTVATELLFGLCSLLFGDWSFLAQLGAALVVAVAPGLRRAPGRRAPRPLGDPLLRVSPLARALQRRRAASDYAGHPLEAARGGWAVAAVTERSLAPQINIVDIHDDVVWSRSGHLSRRLSRSTPSTSPASTARTSTRRRSSPRTAGPGSPRGPSTSSTCSSTSAAASGCWRQPCRRSPATARTERLLEEFRKARLHELTRLEENGNAANLVQDRRHYLCATFRPDRPRGIRSRRRAPGRSRGTS